MEKPPPKWRARAGALLLLVPFAAMLWVPSYNRIAPEVFGVPFFYWYQLLWIPLGAALLLPAFLSGKRGGSG